MVDRIKGGYILLARRLLESELMDMPALYSKMWQYVLLSANYKDTSKLYRGQLLTSYEDLQYQCGHKQGKRREKIKYNTIKNALRWFKTRGMIDITRHGQQMIITVLNYEVYQNPDLYSSAFEDEKDFEFNREQDTVFSAQTGASEKEPAEEQSGQPTGKPTGKPTGQPTGQPTGEPDHALGQPTGQPTGQPDLGSELSGDTQESIKVSNIPGQPTGQPTGKPESPEEGLEEGLEEQQEEWGTSPSGEGDASSASPDAPPSEDSVADEAPLKPQPKKKDCPQEKIIELYHEVLPELPQIRVWSSASQKALRARWREDSERQDLQWWRSYFEYIRESDFLMGRAKDFMADLQWIIGPRNIEKILNGRYHNNKKPSTGNSRTDSNLMAVQAFMERNSEEEIL